MSETFKLIKKTIKIIEDTCSVDLIIYDIYGTFFDTEIVELAQYNRLHSMPYCLRIKSNSRLYNKCRYMKERLLHKTDFNDTVSKSTCFCGVTEYNFPIKMNGNYIGLISATGFRGKIKGSLLDKCASVLGLSSEDLISVQKRELVSTDKEKYVIIMLQILSHLFDEYIKQNFDFLEESTTKNPHVVKALEYIRFNYNKNISVSQVAKECYISSSYLQSLFSYHLGHGVAEEIRNQQLNYAKELLSKTQYSVEHISYLCGFKSSDYFCTVFKREENISPLKYRKATHVNK